jgi:hypothetical protein
MNLNLILDAIVVIIVFILISSMLGLSLIAVFNSGNLPCIGSILIAILIAIGTIVILLIKREKQR